MHIYIGLRIRVVMGETRVTGASKIGEGGGEEEEGGGGEDVTMAERTTNKER